MGSERINETVRVDYAGPGGVCQGMRLIGIDSYGVELDESAVETRKSAGLKTVQADLSTYIHPKELKLTGYCASPSSLVSVEDALLLQSFDPKYPVKGTKSKQFEQVGNTVPPILAAHVVAKLASKPQPLLEVRNREIVKL